MRRLLSDSRGGVGIVIAVTLPLMIGMAAFAVDLGAAQLDTRRLQGVADAAALAAARDPAHAQSAAQAAVDASGWPRPLTVTATAGAFDAAQPAGSRFVASPSAANAVRVALRDESPTYFARIWGRKTVTVDRNATAAQTNLAAFSLGSRLASLQGGVLNGLLSALTGTSVSLSVMDYQGLASAKVDLFTFLDALRTEARLSAGTYKDTLDASVTLPQLLNALAASLPASQAAQAAALRGLALRVPPTTVQLSSLIDLGPLGLQTSGGTGVAQVDALTLLNMLAQLGNGGRPIQLDLGASVAGLAQTKVWLAIGQPSVQSPWLTVTASGTPVLRTAQARLYIETQTANIALPGVGPLVQVKLPLYVELASAEAKLAAIDCAGSPRSVTIDARPSLGQLSIASVDTSRLNDFNTPLVQTPARIITAPLLSVDARANLDLGTAENWQSLRFDQADIDAGTVKSVSSGALTGSAAAALMARVQLTINVLGLPIPLGPLTAAIGQTLNGLAPALDTLIDATTGTIGVHFGEADVRVTGVRCGMAQLVG